jgi:hypothetical protein
LHIRASGRRRLPSWPSWACSSLGGWHRWRVPLSCRPQRPGTISCDTRCPHRCTRLCRHPLKRLTPSSAISSHPACLASCSLPNDDSAANGRVLRPIQPTGTHATSYLHFTRLRYGVTMKRCTFMSARDGLFLVRTQPHLHVQIKSISRQAADANDASA